jgi:hypothetical protein
VEKVGAESARRPEMQRAYGAISLNRKRLDSTRAGKFEEKLILKLQQMFVSIK